jgi:hypothetical protein
VVHEVSDILHDTIDKYHVSVLIELRKGGHAYIDWCTIWSFKVKYPVFYELLFLQLIEQTKPRSGI